jgi:hypothetical protein
LTIQITKIPGCSDEGFLSFRTLRTRAKGQELAAFAAGCPAPALLVVDVTSGAPTGNPEATVRAGESLKPVLNKHTSAYRYLNEVGFLVKRPGNPFSTFVAVGRAANNDLVLALETVSKFHAYFTCDEGRWSLTDQRSTNGTQVNDQALEPSTARPLEDGDRIRFGDEITVVFLTPQALYERARG